MVRKQVLITGADGEIGKALIKALWAEGSYDIVALDLRPLAARFSKKCFKTIQGNICSERVLEDLEKNYCFEVIFHLAALLSSDAEKKPFLARKVNEEGTAGLLELAIRHGKRRQAPCIFMFTSSIAAYGGEALTLNRDNLTPTEDEFQTPITMYGLNKLSMEKLGTYFHRSFADDDARFLDFRCVRFPGLLSPDTEPSGGTSDYAPEMLHCAAKGLAYDSFVGPQVRLGFMVMPDAIQALILLLRAPASSLTQNVYNLSTFSVTAEQIRQEILTHFPTACLGYNTVGWRQRIVESWPADVNDDAARRDWGWAPSFGFKRAFREYLIPRVKKNKRLTA